MTNDLETTAWYALGIPVIAGVFIFEAWLARRRKAPIFHFSETISNLSAGLGTLLIGIFLGPLLLWGWDVIHAWTPLAWPEQGWWKFPAALLLSDFCYYAWHWAGHRFEILWAIHGIHHQHERLNSTVGLRLEWFADPFAALFFVLMPLIGCDSMTGYFAIAILSLYALTVHTPMLQRPGFWLLVTPASHGCHHSRDLRFVGRNFGAMLTVWDRLFGTWQAPIPSAKLREDVPTVARMHDGVSGQGVLIWELIQRQRRLPFLSGLGRLFGSPALEKHQGALVEVPKASIRCYVVVSFLAAVAFSVWLMWLRESHSVITLVVGVLAVLWNLRTIGGFLDKRPKAGSEEFLRLLVSMLLGAALFLEAPLLGVCVFIASLLAWPFLSWAERGSEDSTEPRITAV